VLLPAPALLLVLVLVLALTLAVRLGSLLESVIGALHGPVLGMEELLPAEAVLTAPRPPG
jgi:hypothetical protein